MDGQRWYDEAPYGEDPNRFGAPDENRYAQPDDFNRFADQQPQVYNEPATASTGPVRRTRGPQQRRGTRSGLVLPDAPGYDGYEQAPAGYDAPDQGGYVPSVPPAAMGPLPPTPAGNVFHAPTEAMQAPPHAPAPSTYRSRRPGLAALFALGGVVAELILIKVLFANLFDSTAAAISGTFGSLFAIAGVPMVILGLYGLATGAATAYGPQIGRAWLRIPLAYLPVGLILIIAAGLAA